jgi:glucose/arabinose dehydrogenase
MTSSSHAHGSRGRLALARSRAPLVVLAALASLLAGCLQTDPGPDDGETGGPPATPVDVQLTLVADGFTSPLGVTNAGDGSGRLFVVERRGVVRVVADGVPHETPYVDVRDLLPPPQGENGLLGLAFHPSFALNGRLFVFHTDRGGDSVVAELRADPPDATTVDASTHTVLLRAQPATAVHQSGQLAFGPDGHLYASFGDGGLPSSAQDLTTLHGSLVRLDVDAVDPTLAPPDNPFVAVPGARPEIWVHGLRNPWRFSFDPLTGDLWIADVGQNAVEELNRLPAGDPGGQNYGWPIMEGDRCYDPPVACDTTGLTLPTFAYEHASGWGRSVIGGAVYRGDELPFLRGSYVFGDFVSGDVFVLTDEGGEASGARLVATDLAISSLGSDEAGELYVVDFAGGGLHRLEAVATQSARHRAEGGR